MSRAELLIPEGWRPKIGARVNILPSEAAPLPPAGVWRILDRAPAPNTWWLIPVDEAARQWARECPNQMIQGCTAAVGRLLIPPRRAAA